MNEQVDKLILALAKRMGFETLDTRKSDRLDFKEVAVWSVKEALEAAFKAGVEVGAAVNKK